MCMEDLWMSRHSTTVSLGTLAGPLQIRANANRIAIVFSRNKSLIVADENGKVCLRANNPFIPISYTTSSTNNVPPAGNTGAISASTGDNIWVPYVMHLREWGNVVQQALLCSGTDFACEVYEVVVDTVVQKRLEQMERDRS